MRARNALTRLAAVAPSAEPVLDAGEEDRILARILASPRRTSRQRPLMLVLAGVAVIAAAAIAATLELGNSHPSATHGQRHVALTGTRIQTAGYHFRTPAGFAASSTACAPAEVSRKPTAVLNGFSAAASADGGCVQAAYLIGSNQTAIPVHAVAVAVGNYHGYYLTGDSSGQSTLYVALPKADPSAANPVYLALFAQGLTEDQMVAVAQSGLPASP